MEWETGKLGLGLIWGHLWECWGGREGLGGQAAGAWQGVAEGREVPPDGRSVSARALDPSPLCFRSPPVHSLLNIFFSFSRM